jgi:alkylation response protein AidB-like acyl-CoA dehydrogenase
VLSEDGKHYVLNGQKMWITNAGFADVFIVFAKVDGEMFTAFIVERTFPGVSVAPEEHKMGLQGSSTCAVNLEDARDPVENVLGEIGKGHKIAFNILNLGRLKLGVSTYLWFKTAHDDCDRLCQAAFSVWRSDLLIQVDQTQTC